MITPLLLRLAAGLALVQGLAHGSLLLSYRPSHGPDEVALVQSMQATAFDFGGFQPHSYWEMYIGYGLFAALTCVIEALLFWQLARVAATIPARVRPLAAVFIVANLGYAALMARYFFWMPLMFDLLVASLLGLAIIAASSDERRAEARLS